MMNDRFIISNIMVGKIITRQILSITSMQVQYTLFFFFLSFFMDSKKSIVLVMFILHNHNHVIANSQYFLIAT